MRSMLGVTLLSVLALGMGTAAEANLPPQPPNVRPIPPPPATRPVPKPGQATFVLEVDPKVKQARLVIPRQMVPVMRVSAEAEESTPKTAGLPFHHTLFAGAALSLALTFGGLWVVKQRDKPWGKTLAVLLVTAGLLGTTGLVFANLRVPVPEPPLVAPNPPAPIPLAGVLPDVAVEVVDKGDAIKLIVNREQYGKLIGLPQFQPGVPEFKVPEFKVPEFKLPGQPTKPKEE